MLLRDLEDARKLFSALNGTFVGIGMSAYPRMTPAQFIEPYHVIALRKTGDLPLLRKRAVIFCLEEVLGYPLEIIHVIGGGSQNSFLCQLTADATGKPVIAGPVEATAIGNALVQAISLGYLDSLADGREWVARSFPLREHQPDTVGGWDAAYKKMVRML